MWAPGLLESWGWAQTIVSFWSWTKLKLPAVVTKLLNYLSGHSTFRLNKSSIYFVRPCWHGRINFLHRRICDESKSSGTLGLGIPHYLTIKRWDHLKRILIEYILINSSRQLGLHSLSNVTGSLLTTQSVSVPHCSKWARKLSSVVSKLKPPMKSFRSCSGSRGTWKI